eukprot:RCo015174
MAPPWAGCYPPVPADFVWEPFYPTFLPVVVCALGCSLLGALVLGMGQRLVDRGVLFFLLVSLCSHFGLEGYYAVDSASILTSSALPARIWRHYGVSDTRWLGPQPGVPASQYSCMVG